MDPAGPPEARAAPSGWRAARPDPLSASEFVLLAIFLGTLAASVLLGPGEDGVRVFGVEVPSFCLFRLVTGWRCPGCGLTRSFVYLGHGDLLEAFRMHPLGPILYLVVIQQAAVRSWRTLGALAARRRGAPT